MTTAYLNDCGIVCALGASGKEVRERLFAGATGLTVTQDYSPGRALPLGCVTSPLPDVAHLPLRQRSRNNQLTLGALEQIRPALEAARARYGAARIGVIIGTSTSGVAETEAAMRAFVHGDGLPARFHYGQQEMVSPAECIAQAAGLAGPAYVHSEACASAAKAMASAARLLRIGALDAVVTGGVDSLCGFTVAGFSALESVSAEPCNPLSANRRGINIGEGAGLFLMSREPAAIALRGWGEASDGHHMSAPDPEGSGARLAIGQALNRAGIDAGAIDYINLHGTATPQNDAMESRVVHALFGAEVAVASTKGFTGHALGAAAALEAAFCWLAMQDDNRVGMLPPQLWDGVPDPALPALNVAAVGARLGRPLEWALSNSFAFGGSNAALIFGRTS
ncbi:MAG: beta-ketoacyl-ACP synthase [Gammaproteobacteria bacterium]